MVAERESPDPYRAPVASLDAAVLPATEAVGPASRWARLGAALLEGLVVLVFQAVAIWGLFMIGAVSGLEDLAAPRAARMDSPVRLAQMSVAIILLAVNVWLWSRYAQSIGKRVLGIRIVARDGRPAALPRILLRQLPLQVAGFGIGFLNGDPLVGFFAWVVFMVFVLADDLTIFYPGSRCLHDLWAGTRVVPAGPGNDPDLVSRA